MEHPKDSLSPYLDGALPEAERGRVEEHLRGCPDCAAHAEDLKSVSKLVSSLPRKPLPVGFLQRLNRKAAGPRESPSLSWLPAGPVRLAAFAATGILVTLIVYRETRFHQMRMQYESAWSGSSRQEGTAVPEPAAEPQAFEAPATADKALPMEEAFVRKDRIGEKMTRAPGSPIGVADEAGSAAGADAAVSAARGLRTLGDLPLPGAAGAAGRLAEGGSGGPASNEELQNFLQEEKTRMGIHQILPKNSPPAAPQASAPEVSALPDRPMSKAEAMAAVRQMTSQLSAMNNRRENSLPLVPMMGAEKPTLLASSSESGPMEDAGAAKKKDFLPAQAADSVALAGGSLKEAAPAPQLISADAPEVTKARMRAPAPAAASSLPRLEEKPAAQAWTQSWTGTGGNKQGGFAVKDKDAWSVLWNALGSDKPLPAVDFSKSMALAVFSDSEGMTVEITSVTQQGPRLWVMYRLSERKAEGGIPASPYHIVLIPRSDLPVTFKNIGRSR